MPDKQSQPAAGAASRYVGRFAPSPTGPLHLGSVTTALASFLDARAHHGAWLLRIEDIDPPREQPGAAQAILKSLHELNMATDQPVIWQSQRQPAYQAALESLIESGLVYPCSCSRREILATVARRDGITPDQLRGSAVIYPGTCRDGDAREPVNCSYRINVSGQQIRWADRPAGFQSGKPQSACLAQSVGDFTVRRRDGLWSYQLAVVVDDHFSGVTDVVRGTDLADSTARQIFLHRCLDRCAPRTLHIPVINDQDGNKLSKQSGAAPAITDGPVSQRIALLNQSMIHLGLAPVPAQTLAEFWHRAEQIWAGSKWMR